MTATTATRTVQSAARLDPRPDADLLARFLAHHDQPAFATLVQRHGPLVYGVCRRTLGPTADADDAFQATFLVLVKRAAAIRWRANLGPWLFGVAHRVAAKARFRRDRRFAVEKQVDAMPHPETTPADRTESDELSRAFDEELAKLPDEMRRAVVLCELQGLSRQAAAKQLHISEGTLSSRLGRARKKLAAALTARGVTLSVPVGVGVSVGLMGETVRAACNPAGAVPAGVAYLVQEALTAMTISKLKLGAVVAAVAVGFSWVAVASDPPAASPPAKAAEQPAADPPKKKRLELKIDLKLNPEPVATVNGQDIKREEFGEYLIRKYGAKEVEAFVNKKVIEQAAEKAKVDVSKKEIDDAFDSEVKGVGVSREAFVKTLLPTYGKTEQEWRDQVIRPRLLLAKLGADVTPTEAELKALYERKYGERRAVQCILWPKGTDAATATAGHAAAGAGAAAFDAMAGGQQDPGLAASRGMLGPLCRTTVGTNQAVLDAVFALKVNEVSRLLETDEGWVAVRLVEVIPADRGRTFDGEKAALVPEATRLKAEAALPKVFEKLRDEAKPVYHIKPEPKTYPTPQPKK